MSSIGRVTQNASLKLHLVENVKVRVWFTLFFLADGPTLQLLDFFVFSFTYG